MRHYFSILFYLYSFSKFKSFGKNIHLSLGGKFVRPMEIKMGTNIFISNNFHISARNLTFGNDILIGPNLVIECDDHLYNEIGRTIYECRNKRIGSFVKIENDVWIGANVTILKNVIIGEGSIIGAGSIVTKNMPPYSVCIGSPCKPIKTRFQKDKLTEHLEIIGSTKSVDEIIISWKYNNLIH